VLPDRRVRTTDPGGQGTGHSGAIHALAFTFMVPGSALAPAIMGAALDRGVSFEAITLACAIYCAFASVVAVLAARLYRRR